MKRSMLTAAILSAFAITPAIAQNQPATPNAEPTPRPQAQPLQPEQAREPRPQPDRARPDDAARPAAARENAGADRQDPKSMSEKFVKHASSENLYEIELSRIAQERAQKPEVKQLAKTIGDHHTQAQTALQEAARSSNISVPTELTPVHQAKLSKFRTKTGEEFDKAFLYSQVGGHSEAALWYRDAANELQEPALKQYASTTLPKLREHLQAVKVAANDDSSDAVTASGVQKARPDASSNTQERRSNTPSNTQTPGGSTDENRPVVPERQDGTPKTPQPN